MELPYDIGQEVWVVWTRWNEQEKECASCGHIKKKSIKNKTVRLGKIIELTIYYKEKSTKIWYTIVVDSYSQQLSSVFSTQEEAENQLKKEE